MDHILHRTQLKCIRNQLHIQLKLRRKSLKQLLLPLHPKMHLLQREQLHQVLLLLLLHPLLQLVLHLKEVKSIL